MLQIKMQEICYNLKSWAMEMPILIDCIDERWCFMCGKWGNEIIKAQTKVV